MAQYPTTAPTFTTKVDGVDDAQAAHMNAVQAEITAIGAELMAGWTSYTPTWAGATANPSIGDGTLTGAYHVVGSVVFFEILLSIGTTTTMGTGAWTFTLPVASLAGAGHGAFHVRMLDNPTAFHIGGGALESTTTFSIWPDAAVSAAAANVPMTWASGDTLIVNGWYLKA